MKGTPTQGQGNVARQNEDGTRDKSGDGAELPKYTPELTDDPSAVLERLRKEGSRELGY